MSASDPYDATFRRPTPTEPRQERAASVLLDLVSVSPHPSSEPPDRQVLPPPPPSSQFSGGGMTVPSVGSAAHELRRCKPCAFFWKCDGCQSGQACLFCHLCPPDEKKRRKKERRFVASMGTTRQYEAQASPTRLQRSVRKVPEAAPMKVQVDRVNHVPYLPEEQILLPEEPHQLHDEVPTQYSEYQDYDYDCLPGIVAPELRDVEAQIIQRALMEQEVAEVEAEWGYRPPPSNGRVRLELDKVLPTYSYSGVYSDDDDDLDLNALTASPSAGPFEDEDQDTDLGAELPTLLAPSDTLPSDGVGSDEDKNNQDSFFSFVEAGPDSTGLTLEREWVVDAGRIPWGLLADACAAIIVSLVTFVPASFRNAWDEAELFQEASSFDHFLAPLIASFLLCSSQGGGKGAVQTVLKHQSMASLGHYSLYVYLFQEPLFRSIEAFVPDLEDSAEGFVFFVLCLWLISGLYAEKVEPMLLKISVSSASSDSEPTESTS
ncbi:unnamed protein product [Symbiodinium sp. CCMP2592]|nr:unnamed protein product [Symbiodinium sp. CCMP2592]